MTQQGLPFEEYEYTVRPTPDILELCARCKRHVVSTINGAHKCFGCGYTGEGVWFARIE